MIKKTFQKLIIFSSISLFFIGWASFVSADCYTSVYTPCVENESDLQLEEWSAWDRVSNCHCAGSDLVFDNVCSGEGEFHTYDFDRVYGYPPPPIVYLPIVYHIKGTVLNRSRCPLCLGKGGPVDWFMDEQECLEAGWGCDASYPLQITPGRKSPYPYQCFWRDPETTDEPSIQGCTAMKDYGEKEEGGVLHIYHTYQPCKPPPPLPTCQEKCQTDHQRDGKCLSAPDPASGFPKALKQEGQFRDCVTGQSCYCQNHKPVVEEVSLELNPRIKEQNEKLFEISSIEEDIISEYDVYRVDKDNKADSLTCRASISDVDEEDLGCENLSPDFELLAGWTVNDDFQSLGKIRAKCQVSQKEETTNWLASIDKNLAEKVKRGMLLKCRVTPKDPYQKGEAKVSNILAVADHLYYFFRTQDSWGDAKDQYSGFLNKSAVTNNFRDMKDRTQRIGKSYFYNESLVFRMIIPTMPEELIVTDEELQRMTDREYEEYSHKWYEFVETWRKELAKRVRNVATGEIGIKYSRERDDKITLISDTALSAYSEVRGTPGEIADGVVETFGGDIIFLRSNPYNSLISFAHEMAHASINSHLCDEGTESAWRGQNTERPDCPNPFPDCCLGQPGLGFCGASDFCPGMPYHPDENSPRPRYKIDLKVPESTPNYLSIMSPNDIFTMRQEVKIYPIEAQCPLRNCK